MSSKDGGGEWVRLGSDEVWVMSSPVGGYAKGSSMHEDDFRSREGMQ